jgi:hypothetical protein
VRLRFLAASPGPANRVVSLLRKSDWSRGFYNGKADLPLLARTKTFVIATALKQSRQFLAMKKTKSPPRNAEREIDRSAVARPIRLIYGQ